MMGLKDKSNNKCRRSNRDWRLNRACARVVELPEILLRKRAPPALAGTQSGVLSGWGLGPHLVSLVPCLRNALGVIGDFFKE